MKMGLTGGIEWGLLRENSTLNNSQQPEEHRTSFQNGSGGFGAIEKRKLVREASEG